MGAMYVSPSFGFMMGVTYALKVGLSVPSEMSAIAVLIGFWDSNTKVCPIQLPWNAWLTKIACRDLHYRLPYLDGRSQPARRSLVRRGGIQHGDYQD